MPAACTIHRATNGQYSFNLTAENNEKISTSEMYRDLSGATNGIASVGINSPVDAEYQRKTSADGRPYFLLVAANLEVIGRGETYSSSAAMEDGIAAVKRNGPGAPVRDEA